MGESVCVDKKRRRIGFESIATWVMVVRHRACAASAATVPGGVASRAVTEGCAAASITCFARGQATRGVAGVCGDLLAKARC